MSPSSPAAASSSDLPAWGAIPVGGDASDGTSSDGPGPVRFRLWAPDVEALTLRLGGTLSPDADAGAAAGPKGTDPDGAGPMRPAPGGPGLSEATDHAMDAEGDGWFSLVADAAQGTPYLFVLPDGRTVPDPASRAQAAGVDGPSLVTAPGAYRWRTDWRGRPWEEAVICEIHIGTFTEGGTFRAAIDRLDHLARTGFTAIELMPVAQFAGNRGWGYDGVLLYAPHNAYGTPDDLRALVDAAHERGLMVLLDVVYNHFGPEGNYLPGYASDFFHPERHTPWGAAIAYDRPAVRRFVIDNVLYWLEEFRLDGLRFDAIDHIADPSEPEILIEAARAVRARIADRPVHLTSEDNRNVTHLHERAPDGSAPLFTAEWNDDLHNVAHVVATHESEGYYQDFAGHRWEYLARALAHGFAYDGQVSPQTGKPRGTSSAHLPPAAFVDFLQNHDQIGNRAFGERLCALSEDWVLEGLTAILLLSPHIPLMFMGEDYGEERPFCFFADFHGDLATAVTEGRRREFADFDAFQATGVHHVPDPIAPQTFATSRLDWSHADTADGRAVRDRVRRLLALRRDHVVPHLAGTRGGCGTVLSHEDGALAVDWTLGGAGDGNGQGGGIRLQLRANLSDERRDLPPAEGTCIHRTGRDGDVQAGAPRSVLHFTAPA